MATYKTIKTLDITGKGNRKAVVFFERAYEEDWGYMNMRDYRTYEPTDRYSIAVVHYDMIGHAHNCDAGYSTYSFRSVDINKDIANKIWYNLNNGRTYTDLYKFCKDNNLIAKEA